MNMKKESKSKKSVCYKCQMFRMSQSFGCFINISTEKNIINIIIIAKKFGDNCGAIATKKKIFV